MKKIKIKTELRKRFPVDRSIDGENKLKKHVTNIFKNLEGVVEHYDNLKLVERKYKDSPDVQSGSRIKGELSYDLVDKDNPNKKYGRLNLKLWSAYEWAPGCRPLNSAYAEIEIYLKGDADKTDKNIVEYFVEVFNSPFKKELNQSDDKHVLDDSLVVVF